MKDVCLEIAKRYEIVFIEIGVEKDHVHFLIQSVPRYSPTRIVRVVKSITARVTCPPKTGPDYVIVFWDNLGVKEGGGYESKAVHGGKDYWDAAGSRSFPGPREEDRGGLSQSWDF